MHKKPALYVLMVVLLCLSVFAAVPTYTITIKENGQCDVLIELEKGSEYSLSLPPDAQLTEQGAVYFRNNSIITAYTGDLGKGTIGYTTDSYTVKIKDVWRFEMSFSEPANATVLLPENIYIKSIYPVPVIRDDSLVFGNTGDIAIGYGFSQAREPVKGKSPLRYIILGLTTLIVIAIVVWHLRMPAAKSAKQNIIRTLPHNERKIINILIENNGEIKRNVLERLSRISKSSLANSLNNLEKKNIIEIDKTFVVHYVRLSQWFRGI